MPPKRKAPDIDRPPIATRSRNQSGYIPIDQVIIRPLTAPLRTRARLSVAPKVRQVDVPSLVGEAGRQSLPPRPVHRAAVDHHRVKNDDGPLSRAPVGTEVHIHSPAIVRRDLHPRSMVATPPTPIEDREA
jgi:hypothetical protein